MGDRDIFVLPLTAVDAGQRTSSFNASNSQYHLTVGTFLRLRILRVSAINSRGYSSTPTAGYRPLCSRLHPVTRSYTKAQHLTLQQFRAFTTVSAFRQVSQ